MSENRQTGLVVVVLLLGWFCTGRCEVLFYDGFESGLGNWKEEVEKQGGSTKLEKSSNKARKGSYSARFVCNSCRRVELSKPPHGKYDWGTEYWVGYSFLMTKAPGGFRIINQRHSTPGNLNWSCPAGGNSFTIKGESGNITFYTSTDDAKVNVIRDGGGATANTETFSEAVQMNEWIDVVMNFKYAPDNRAWFKPFGWVNLAVSCRLREAL